MRPIKSAPGARRQHVVSHSHKKTTQNTLQKQPRNINRLRVRSNNNTASFESTQTHKFSLAFPKSK